MAHSDPPPPASGRRETACWNHSAGSCKSQKSSDSKASPGQPSAADPSLKNNARVLLTILWRQFSIFLHTFCRSKIHQKSDPSKRLPKSQKSEPRAPQGRFRIIFGPRFAPFFIKNRDPPKTSILQQVLCGSTILHVKGSHFGIKNPSKIHVFPRTVPGPPFSRFFKHDAPKSGFCDPLQNPLGSKMAPKICQVAPKGRQKA